MRRIMGVQMVCLGFYPKIKDDDEKVLRFSKRVILLDITEFFLIYDHRFSTLPIRGIEKFTDQKGWGDDVLYNFQEYCREQFEMPGLTLYLNYNILE
jgi:hypothetical protein